MPQKGLASFAFLTALVVAPLMSTPSRAGAQVVIDPTRAEFSPSVDHSATGLSGTPRVTSYQLQLYLIGASAPFQISSLGKPAPDPDGTIRVDLGSILVPLPAPGIDYVATVTAVGPGGVGTSALSNTFAWSGPCSYSIVPTSQSVAAAGGPATATVTAASGCAWSATTAVGWITSTSGASGIGSGTVSYSVAANTSSSPRTGTLTIGGQTLTVIQSGASCSHSIAPTSQSMGYGGGTATVNVTTAGSCGWTAASNNSWISVTAGSSGTGSGSVTYTVASSPNPSKNRIGTLTVAGQAVTVTQGARPPSAPGRLRIIRQ